MGYSLIHVDDIEPAGPGGAVRFVRRELGVEAFGVNWFVIPPNGVGREHDESESGQEEVNVIVGRLGLVPDRRRGRARCASAPSSASTPGRRASPIAGPEGMTMIGIGAPTRELRAPRPLLEEREGL